MIVLMVLKYRSDCGGEGGGEERGWCVMGLIGWQKKCKVNKKKKKKTLVVEIVIFES